MIIFGVDPGTQTMGFGIIEYSRNEVSYIKSGTITLKNIPEQSQKISVIYKELSDLIKIYKPDEFAIETAFYGKNIQSAMKLGYVRGVAVLAAVHSGIPAKEYSPREIKKAITGKGSAAKEQVQYMILHLLKIKKKFKNMDESDALAIAVCHAFKLKTLAHKSSSWKDFILANPGRIIE